ncbi:DUF6350 family protein [Nocardia sp. 348MFTsu5.1]|uniref:cell division protein PerM n=1 Tax=Nocardia sp. 348MFTsu5.1 TaxID=1172185 RepID=UPI0012DE7AA6|nr:DUF6350 family protein [Nocardia sp. 348MFTsu5.1]
MASSTAENLAARLREIRRSRRADEVGAADSARALVRLAFGTTAATLAILTLLAIVTLLTVGDGLGSLPVAVASMWLGIHQVPMTVGDVTVGVMPLAPTFLMIFAVGRSTARATDVDRPHSEVASVVLAAVGGPLLATVLSLAVVMDASTVMTVQSPDALLAFSCTFAVQAVGAVGGVAYKWWSTIVVRTGVADWVIKGLRCGLIAVVGMFTLGALVVAFRLIINWSLAGELLASGNGVVGALGLFLLSVLYLPNVVIGSAAAMVGAPVQVGGATVDLFGSSGGRVPPLPILAVLPDGDGGRWGLVLLAGAVIVSFFVAHLCADLSLLRNIRMVVVAAGVTSVLLVAFSAVSGGSLGVLGEVGVNLPVVGVFAFGWIAVAGALMAVIHSALPSTRRARMQAMNLIYDDYADEEFDRFDDVDDDTDDVADAVPAEPEFEYREPAEIPILDRDAGVETEIATSVDGWDIDDWATETDWDDSDSAAIESVGGEELVSTDEFGTRRRR